MVQPNYQFRALTQNAAEAKTVRDAFARSVLWSFPIAATSDGRYLVDYTDFLVRDWNNIAGRLQEMLLKCLWRLHAPETVARYCGLHVTSR